MRSSNKLFLYALATALTLAGCRERQTKKPEDAATLAPDGKSASNEIVIGEFGSLTGSEATFGTSVRDGVDLAIREANQGGGVKGKKIRVKVYDDQGKAEEAASVVTKLITQDR